MIRDIGAVQLESRAQIGFELGYLIEPCQYHVYLLYLSPLSLPCKCSGNSCSYDVSVSSVLTGNSCRNDFWLLLFFLSLVNAKRRMNMRILNDTCFFPVRMYQKYCVYDKLISYNPNVYLDKFC